MAPSVRDRSGPLLPVAGGILAFLLLPAMMFSPVAAAQPYQYKVESGMDYPGNDFRPSEGPAGGPGCSKDAYGEDLNACEARCDAAATCAGFVYYADVKCCFIKSKMANFVPQPRTVSYSKIATSCSDLADQCDWFFQGSGTGNSIPTFDLGNGKGDHAISPPVTYKNGQKVQVINTNGGYTYTGRPIPHENQNQFYGNGAKVFYRTFNSPVDVNDYKGRCFSLRLTSIELDDGTNLNPGDGNADFKEARRCVVFATRAEEKGFSAV